MADLSAYATPDDICRAFFTHVQAAPNGELAYEDLWRLLRAQGMRLRGASPKKERDTVHRALTNSSRVVKVRPGVFAPRD